MSANNIKIRKITDLQLILIRRHYIMKLVPLADRVVLKQLEAETKTMEQIILLHTKTIKILEHQK